MNLAQKLIVRAGLIGSLGILGCKTDVTGSVDLNVDQQNRGTVTGKALVSLPYRNPNGTYVGVSDANIKFINSSNNALIYRTTSGNGGNFLIEVPAGSYNVSGCYRSGANGWGTSATSATVSRGNTFNMGDVKLDWQNAFICVNF